MGKVLKWVLSAEQPVFWGGPSVLLSDSGRGSYLQPWIYPESLLLKLHSTAAVPSHLLTPHPCISAADHFMHHDRSMSASHDLIDWQEACQHPH